MRDLAHKIIDRNLEELIRASVSKRKSLWLKKLASFCFCIWCAVYLLSITPAVNSLQNELAIAVDGVTAQAPELASAKPVEQTQLPGFKASVETLLPKTENTSIVITLKKGTTLTEALIDSGIADKDAREIVGAVSKSYNPKSIGTGKEITITGVRHWLDGLKLTTLEMQVAPDKQVVVSANSGKFKSEVVETPLSKELYYANGVIHDSLFETALKMGVPANKMVDIINLYSYDVDFQRDIKDGDNFEVIIEKFYNQHNEFSHYGRIIYSSLEAAREKHSYYYYASADGTGDFYNDLGESIKKALLKTPINAARLTSGFGIRNHPVLGYTRMHRGVDFAAATGTPIFAAGDGVVNFSGRKSGYGNYLQIKHNDKYETAYAHLSAFGAGVKNGVRVKQGQVVAYVGATGMATGPHLHYEVLVNGQQVNPLSVKFASGKKLAGKELAEFKGRAGSIKTYLASVPKPGEATKLASAK